MNESTIAQTVLFSEVADRPVIATFDQPHASSDGGAILLKAADRRLGLLAALGLILSFHLTSSRAEPRPIRVVAAGAVPLLATTIYLTLSRGGIKLLPESFHF